MNYHCVRFISDETDLWCGTAGAGNIEESCTTCLSRWCASMETRTG